MDERSRPGIRRPPGERRKTQEGRVGRKQLHASVFGPSRGHVRKMLSKWVIVNEVVRDKDQHQQLGPQPSCELVVERELVDLAGVPAAEGGGREVQPRQFPDRHFFEADVKLAGDRNFLRSDKRVADHGDVTTRRGARRGDRFTIEKTEAVGARNGPVVEISGVAYLRIGLQYQPHVGNEMRGDGRRGERHFQPEPGLADAGDQNQARGEKQEVPGGDLQQAAHPLGVYSPAVHAFRIQSNQRPNSARWRAENRARRIWFAVLRSASACVG